MYIKRKYTHNFSAFRWKDQGVQHKRPAGAWLLVIGLILAGFSADAKSEQGGGRFGSCSPLSNQRGVSRRLGACAGRGWCRRACTLFAAVLQQDAQEA